MTASAGVDLDDAATRRLNALGIVERGLVSFDHRNGQLIGQVADGSLQKRRLSGPRRADQVERQDVSTRKPAAIAFGQQAVFGQQVLFESNYVAVMMRGH